MRGALPNGKSNTKGPRISATKWKVCHTIKGSPTCLSMGITGYVVRALNDSYNFILHGSIFPFQNDLICLVS